MNSQFIRDSFWGRIVYHLSGHKYFNHREEQPDYEIPTKYLSGSEKNEFTVTQESQELSELSISSSSSSSTIAAIDEVKADDSLIVVDWDGPDDPENPYNWPLLQKVIILWRILE